MVMKIKIGMKNILCFGNYYSKYEYEPLASFGEGTEPKFWHCRLKTSVEHRVSKKFSYYFWSLRKLVTSLQIKNYAM